MKGNEMACDLNYKEEYKRLCELLSETESTVRTLDKEVKNLAAENKYLKGQIAMVELIFGGKIK